MEKFKIDISKIGTACNAFIADNREVIGGIVGTIFTAKLCKSLGISLGNFGYFGNGFNCFGNRSDNKSIIVSIGAPVTSMESAIYGIYKSTANLSDYYKELEAERIYDILKDSKDTIDDQTKSYAIQALNGIQESMSSSYYKSCVGDVIQKILKL